MCTILGKGFVIALGVLLPACYSEIELFLIIRELS